MKKILTYMLPILFLSCSHKDKEVEQKNEESLTSVKVTRVNAAEESDSLYLSGLLATENEAKLSFKTGGVIDRIYVREGELVKKGQLLASLKVTEINSQFEQTNLALEKAQRDYSRASNLYKDSVITLEQLQNEKTALDIARRSVDAVAFNQQYSFIKSETDGFVTGKLGNEGEVIAPGEPVITMDETAGNRGFILKVGVTDEEWASISEGQKANIQLDAYPDKTFNGWVYRKSRSADQPSGSFQVDIRINFDSETPATGMFGKATLVPGKPVKVFSIPYDALIQVNGNRACVYSPSKDNTIKKVGVVIKSFNEKNVIIQSGVQEGDFVVVSNNAFLNEQSKITIAK